MICQTVSPLLNRCPVLAEVYAYFMGIAGSPAGSPLLKIANGEFTAAAKAAAEELNTACCFWHRRRSETGNPRNSAPISLYAPEAMKQAWWYLDRGEPIPAKAFTSPYVKKLTDILRLS